MADYDNNVGSYSILTNPNNTFQSDINNNNNGLLLPSINNDQNQQSSRNSNNHFILTHQQQQQYGYDHGQIIHNSNNNDDHYHQTSGSGLSYIHDNNPNSNLNPNSNHYHNGVDIDTATIVSIASSCIILISGCIAVVCLIMYMKKTDMLYRSRTCAKCGAHVTAHMVAGPASNASVNILTDGGQQPSHHHQPSGTPISIRSENMVRSAERAEHHANVMNYQQMIKSQPNLNAKEPIDNTNNLIIYRSGGILINPQMQQTQPTSSDQRPNDQSMFNQSTTTVAQINNFLADALRNNESKTSFINNVDDDDEEDDVDGPYATFNLPGFENNATDSKLLISDTYETFAAKFSEPPYMLLKKGLECHPQRPQPPAQYADSINDSIENCKLKLLSDQTSDDAKQSIYNQSLNNSNSININHYHSIASCVSSNQDELLNAYEFGKKQQQNENLLINQLQNDISIQQMSTSNNNNLINDHLKNESIYNNRSLIDPSDPESPTDPGIREFTKSPPKPNEKRQGIVYHQQPTLDDIMILSKQMTAPKTIKDVDQKIMKGSNSGEETSSNETSKSLSSLKASSIEDDDDDDSTPSGDELGNDEQSSSSSSAAAASSESTSTATPESDKQQQQQQPSQTTNLSNNKKYFDAISRDRSRNPSWANYTTMKSNQILSLPSENLTIMNNNNNNENTNQINLNMSNKRAFVTNDEIELSNSIIDESQDEYVSDDNSNKQCLKKGLSSDDYEDIIQMLNLELQSEAVNEIFEMNNNSKVQKVGTSSSSSTKINDENNKSPTTLLESIAMHIKQNYGNDYDYHSIDLNQISSNQHTTNSNQQLFNQEMNASYEDNLTSLLLSSESDLESIDRSNINNNDNTNNIGNNPQSFVTLDLFKSPNQSSKSTAAAATKNNNNNTTINNNNNNNLSSSVFNSQNINKKLNIDQAPATTTMVPIQLQKNPKIKSEIDC